MARAGAIVISLALMVALAGCSHASAAPTVVASSVPPTGPEQSAALTVGAKLAGVIQEVSVRFDVADPARQKTRVLPADAGRTSAVDALTSAFDLAAEASAYVHASIDNLSRVRRLGPETAHVETRADDVLALGADATGTRWARVRITQERRLVGSDLTTTSSTTYAVGWRDASLTAVRAFADGVDPGVGEASAVGVTRDFLAAVLEPEPRVAQYTGEQNLSEADLAALHAMLDASAAYSVVELPGAQLGSSHVTYVVADSGETVARFVVTPEQGGEHAVVAWDRAG